MKIAIINNQASFLNFFVNLAKYLELHDNQLVFLNPDNFIKRVIVKNNLKYENFSELTSLDNYYDSESDFIRYYKQLFGIKNTQKLVNQKNKEFSRAFNYLSSNRFDYILLFNGALNVEADVCKALNLKTFYFEQGYFPNTIQMDRAGVNCNADFAKFDLLGFQMFRYYSSEFKPTKDFVIKLLKTNLPERYFFRFFDLSFFNFFKSFLNRKRKLYKAKKRFDKIKPENYSLENFGRYIFFPLQVNSDTQIVLNSKYSSMYEAIEDILPVLKNTGFKIILKEHPFEVEPVDYSKFVDGETVFLAKKTDINYLIQNAEFVVNINSSVGFQAIEKYKKVLIIGESFYDYSPLSIKFSHINPNELINEINKIVVDKDMVDKYLNKFRNDIFIPGHFYAITLEMLEMIRNRLI